MDDHLEAARRIHRSLPVFDGHNDLPWAIRLGAEGSLETADPRGPLPDYHTDVPRLLEGGVGAQFWSVFVPVWNATPLRTTIEQIDLVHRMVARCAPSLELARTSTDVERIRTEGHVACLLGVEGGHSMEGSLGALRVFARLGVRYMTLTHGANTEWADSATDDAQHGGLTAFGTDVVRAMNDIGMLVDLSHVSVETMWDALAVSAAPVIASHSGAYALAAHPRNVPDDVLSAIAENGGVVMVNFFSGFVIESSAKKVQAIFAEAMQLQDELGDDRAVEAAMAEREAADPIERGTVSDVVDHIEHIAEICGIDHVGIGSDFDGVNVLPEGLEDVSCYPAITAELLRRGWQEADIRKVLGDNALRVLAAAEQVAAAASSRPSS
jgi:membrane dipeptidase